MDEKSNFWAMGDTGPCGPCSEIFYDHGAGIPGGPPGSKDEDGDRYVEIWNLVFMQFERSADGKMTPLPRPSVDTGMGLERTAAVMQGVHSNYDIDLFRNLIQAAVEATHAKDATSPSLRVIADHIRACSFLIVDGVIPGNDGRGYVLRRIIRRAIRHGYKLGQEKPFFHTLVPALAAEMGAAFPELVKGEAHVVRVLKQEEERFAETLENGMALLESAIGKMKGKTIAGETVFKLYDTYGFPVDLTADIARERGLAIDQSGFEKEMQSQRERARAASKFGVDLRSPEALDAQSTFCGYEHLQGEGKLLAILKGGVEVDAAAAGDEVQIVLDRTPFYAESGGQVGDVGSLSSGPAATIPGHRHPEARRCPPACRQGRGRQLSQGRRPSLRPWTARHARRPCSITPPRTCCTRRCARSSARTSSRKGRWSRRIGCASISRIRSRSVRRSSRRSSGW